MRLISIKNEKMVEVEVNNRKIVVEEGWPLIEVCREAGVEIPRFCYHESLGIAGNCRMCLVEVERSLKPVASCAMPVAAGMKIHTESLLVKKAREGIMEFLLANHPLDCPICDQGGECDLQDQAMVFGNDRGRFYEEKRAVVDKDCGPLVKTVMTRCIHCTRCVRFMSEVAGTNELGVMGRGNSMEIGGYLQSVLTSEVSGNVIDLCPVGALTSKPYAFKARPWELRAIESIDVFDSMGSHVRLEVRGNELLRVLPLVNDEINQNWITDKTRFAFDGLRYQRLTHPMVKVDGYLTESSWLKTVNRVVRLLHEDNSSLDVAVGNFVDMESMMLVRELINELGYGRISGQANVSAMDTDCSKHYLCNTPLSRVEEGDVCLLVGINIRVELPLLAVRLRGAQREFGLELYRIGGVGEYYLDVATVGTTRETWLRVLEGRHWVCSKLASAEKPMVFLGGETLSTDGTLSLSPLLTELKRCLHITSDDWDGRNVVYLGASHGALNELGIGSYVPQEGTENSVLYALGADDLEIAAKYKAVIYQGHHGDSTVEIADIVLPGTSYIEKEGTYVNLEGRWQETRMAVAPVGEMRNDWTILRVLLEKLVEYKCNFGDTVDAVRERLSEIAPARKDAHNGSIEVNVEGLKGVYSLGGFNNVVSNYYGADSISRASKIMRSSAERLNRKEKICR